MKSQSFRALLLSAFVVATPGLTFARGEGARVYSSKAYETRKPSCIDRNVGVRAGGNVYPHRGGPSRIHAVAFTNMGGSAFRK
jgi:hypothetical protein